MVDPLDYMPGPKLPNIHNPDQCDRCDRPAIVRHTAIGKACDNCLRLFGMLSEYATDIECAERLIRERGWDNG